jgi:GTPase SAR1 family protein
MYSWDNAQVVLVGNKCDLEQDRAVTHERGRRLADQLGKLNFCLDVRLLFCLVICFLSMLCCVLCFSKGSTDKNTFMGKNPGYINWK